MSNLAKIHDSPSSLQSSETRANWYEPRSLDEAMLIAKSLAKSPLARKSTDDVFMLMLMGAELGLTPAQSLREIHVIEGRPTMSASLIVGLCLRSGVCEYFTPIDSECDAAKATYEAKRKGAPGPVRFVFTMEDAKRAGVLNRKNWQQHPGAMLRARCSSHLARAVFPDVVGGLYDLDSGEISSRREDDEPARVEVLSIAPSPARAIEPVEPVVIVAEEEPIFVRMEREGLKIHLSDLSGIGEETAIKIHKAGLRSARELLHHMLSGFPVPQIRRAPDRLTALQHLCKGYGLPIPDAYPEPRESAEVAALMPPSPVLSEYEDEVREEEEPEESNAPELVREEDPLRDFWKGLLDGRAPAETVIDRIIDTYRERLDINEIDARESLERVARGYAKHEMVDAAPRHWAIAAYKLEHQHREEERARKGVL